MEPRDPVVGFRVVAALLKLAKHGIHQSASAQRLALSTYRSLRPGTFALCADARTLVKRRPKLSQRGK